tara:strand:+ start:2565 stop:2921 length:357 start_codon:yes stop_codon:yes gene_type:complete
MIHNLEEFDEKYLIAKEDLIRYSNKVLEKFKIDLSNITDEYKAIPAFDLYFDSENLISNYIDEKYPPSELTNSEGTYLINLATLTRFTLQTELPPIHKQFSEAYKDFLKGLPENSSPL